MNSKPGPIIKREACVTNLQTSSRSIHPNKGIAFEQNTCGILISLYVLVLRKKKT